MSSQADSTALLNANFGNISGVLANEDRSLYANRGFQAVGTFATNNTVSTTPVGPTVTFGSEQRWNIRKQGGRVARMWIRLRIAAGTLAAGNAAAYVNYLGQTILEYVRVEYQSKSIQAYNGELEKAVNRLMFNDIDRELYNALILGNLPPGSAGETLRINNVSAAVTLYIPLDWLWYCMYDDYALTPEAIAGELQLIIKWRQLENLIYARTVPGGITPVVDPFTVRPVITEALLFQQLIYENKPAKVLNLQSFTQGQGQIFKIRDIEEQRNMLIPLAAGVYRVKLENLRLDSQYIAFFIRDTAMNTPWAVDRTSSDATATLLAGGGAVNAIIPFTSFRMFVNGSLLIDVTTELEMRVLWRYLYMPTVNAGEGYYFIPFARKLQDARNVTGFQNLANLGTVELELTMGARPRDSWLDAYNICHNIIQQLQGDILKIVR